MRQVKTMNVSLSPELHAYVTGKLATGRFSSASEVVRAALRLLEAEERRQETSERRKRVQDQRLGR